MDAGLTNLNTEVQELQHKIYDNQKGIKAANDHCLYQEVYNRRECERFEPRSHFKSRLSLIVRVNVVLNRTVVVDSD